MPQQLVDLAERCAVRIEDERHRFLGSGFFVARNQVVTCAHVAKRRTHLWVRWADSDPMPVRHSVCVPNHPLDRDPVYASPDLALLTVKAPAHHPVALLSGHNPRTWAQAVAKGFSDETPANDVALDTFTVEVVGASAPPLLKVRNERVPHGMSGSLVLDKDSGAVCGVVKANDGDSLRGTAWIVPIEEVLLAFPFLAGANAAEHPPGSRWRDLATRRSEPTRRLFGTVDPTVAPDVPPNAPPSWWLDPRHRVVAFHPRPELDLLIAWATDPSSAASMIKLVVGHGGVGKTRKVSNVVDSAGHRPQPHGPRPAAENPDEDGAGAARDRHP